MQAMLKLMPLPEYDPRTTTGNYNYDSEEITDVPKLNNVVRVDWRPTDNDSLSFTFKDWVQDQRGTRIPAGPSNWQWFNAHYKNTDRGFTGNYTKVLRSNIVWDTDFGTRRQTEVFFPLSDAEWDKTNRDVAGFDVSQFHPELNPRDVLPRVNFGNITGNAAFSPNFTYDTRLFDRGVGWLTSVRSNLTYLRGRHSFKVGGYCRRHSQLRGQGRRRRRVVGRRLQLRRRYQQPARHELRLRQRAARQFHLATRRPTASPTCAASGRRPSSTSRTPGSRRRT